MLLQEYEGAVEDRNHTGIMLIDRNDELCILYEKANTQEEVMRKGVLTCMFHNQLASNHKAHHKFIWVFASHCSRSAVTSRPCLN